MAKIKEEELRLNIVVNGDPVRKEMSELMNKNRQLKAANEDLERSQKKLAAAGKEDSNEYKELTRQITANKAAMAGNRDRIDQLTGKLKVNDMTVSELNRRIKDLTYNWKKLDPKSEEWKKCNAELTQTKNRLRELKGSAGETQSVLGKMSSGYSALVGKFMMGYAVIRGFFSLFSGGFKKIKEFEQANVNLSTILGVHVSQMNGLTKSALELGRTTEYTASQVTNLQTELAKLGFGQQQILQMTKPVLQFATAVGAELPEAAALAGATLRAFDKDATETDDVLATMAVATNKSALSFNYLQTSMSIVAPVAKTFGFDVKDTTALLGTLANSGFDASSAATATRNILLNLADANGKLAKELGKPVRSLPDLIDGLKKLDAKGVNLAKTLELTDKRSVAAFNTFLRGADNMAELRNSLQDVDGELKRISDERLNTVEGSIKLMKSAWEGLMLSFYNSKGIFKFVIDGITSLITGVTKLVEPSERFVDQLERQSELVIRLEDDIRPLVEEYDALKGKVSLNADEQEHLKKLTQQLGDAYPPAITAIDEYGNAIDINTDKIYENIKAERARLKVLNKEAIKELEENIEKQTGIIEAHQAIIERGYEEKLHADWTTSQVRLSEERIQQLRTETAEAAELRSGYMAELKRLNGQEIEELLNARRERQRINAEAEQQRAKEEKARQEKEQQQAAAAAAYKALDEKELAERIALKQKYLNGEIATEQEYNDRLLQLNIDTLKKRLKSGELKGKERLTMEEQLTTLLLQQKKEEQKRLDEIEAKRIENITDPIEKEEALYAQQQKKYAGNTAMLEQLAKNHARKLNAIKLKQALDSLKAEETSYKETRALLIKRQAEDLALTTLTNAQRKQRKKEHIEELKALDFQYYEDTLQKVQRLFAEGQIDIPTIDGLLKSIDLDSKLLSEEERRQLQTMIDALTDKLREARTAVNDLGFSFSQKQGDIFGFSQDDWNLFFEHLKEGKFHIEDFEMAFLAVCEAANMALELYSGYDKMMSAKENAELKRYKKNQDVKKKQLQTRLDAGLITEAQHTAAVERMEADYERKQEEMQIKQAKRQKAISITQAIVNTAAGVVKTLAEWGIPWGLIPAGIMAAMGAAQIAMMAATPIAGAEEGGFPVERMQDGKRFNAQLDPNARGYVRRPTVLVGENGMEYVIPNEAMQNPTARPIIDTIEAVRRKGRLRDFDFSQILPTFYAMPERATGGQFTSTTTLGEGAAPNVSPMGNYDPALLRSVHDVVEKLSAKLDEPIYAYVTLLGRNGLIEQMKKYERNKNLGKLG